MYLSLLKLNPRNRQVNAERADPYQMHRTLCRAWGDDCKAARPLFRLETSPQQEWILLVQSQLEPNWKFLDSSGYLLRSAQCKPFEPRFETGQVLAFRLRANPTKADASRRGEKRNRGKRIGLFKTEDRRNWLLRRAEACGFSIPVVGELDDDTPVHDFRLSDEKVFRATPEGPDKSQQAILSAALFDGRLIVCDPKTFLNAVQNGIGPAKAFGFGLLSLRRA